MCVTRAIQLVFAIALVLCACASGAADEPHGAGGYPQRPIRMLAPYPPGGAVDILARLIAGNVSAAWSQPVIVDNRPGGNATIATDLTAKSAPDGYTLLMTSSTHSVLPSLYPKLPFDVVRDFSAIALVATGYAVLLAHPSVPAQSVKELIAWVRSRPGRIDYASTGFGGSGHLAMELLKHRADLDITHIPYKGASPALTDLVAGRVSLMFANVVPALPHIRSGRLKALAVSSPRRLPMLAEVPTVAESGVPGFDVTVWLGVLGPARMPQGIVRALNERISTIAGLPEVKERLVALGFDPATATPAQFASIIHGEVDKWGRLVRDRNIKLD